MQSSLRRMDDKTARYLPVAYPRYVADEIRLPRSRPVGNPGRAA